MELHTSAKKPPKVALKWEEKIPRKHPQTDPRLSVLCTRRTAYSGNLPHAQKSTLDGLPEQANLQPSNLASRPLDLFCSIQPISYLFLP